jgi:hypothetical protein
MKLKTIPTKPIPEVGDFKIIRRFAWFPKTVEDKVIWLEKYKRVYEYRPKVDYYPGTFLRAADCLGWDLIAEQLIKPFT